MSTEITISVRNLVEFLMRSGDLDNRTAAAPEDAMLEGTRMHRRLQKQEGAGYSAEVMLRSVCRMPCGAELTLEGRADGIYTGCDPEEEEEELCHIDEIKTTYRRLSGMKAPEPVHLAQAKCYAWMYAQQNGLGRIGIRMTYCNLDTEEVRYFYEKYDWAELDTWFCDLLGEYDRWVSMNTEWKEKRTESIRKIVFPFAYREGQRELTAGVYRTIHDGRKLFLEAPTGSGKTIAALYPSIKSMGEGVCDKIFYLTARTVTGAAAAGTLELLRSQGLKMRSTQITARDKICILEKAECNPDACPRAKGHFDRINDAIFDMLSNEECCDRNTIEKYAQVHDVCPFEMSLDVSLFSDTVICDYNYAFDPHTYLRRFFGEGTSSPYVFLIDEAHNLVERGRDMYSASLDKEEVLELRRSVKDIYPGLEKKLTACNSALLAMKKEQTGEIMIRDDIDRVVSAVTALDAEIHRILDDRRRNPEKRKNEKHAEEKQLLQQPILDFYFQISHFLYIWEKLDEHYVIYTTLDGEDGFSLRLYCADPSVNLRECMDRGRSTILFSATFLPIQYYKALLGGTAEDYEVYARTAFDCRKQGIFIARDVTSRYQRRGQEEYRKIAYCIHNFVSGRDGNYLLFFPSHSFLDEVYEIYCTEYTAAGTECVRQEPHMTEQQRTEFLERFDRARVDTSLLGFCVLGGIFAEGIDLTLDRLIGVAVVGTGIPMVCAEREILKNYFDASGVSGYDFAYRFPGMNKVLQAVGRVIRTEEDVGIAALLDDRFLTAPSRRLFPQEWQNCIVTDSSGIGRHAERFWDEWL